MSHSYIPDGTNVSVHFWSLHRDPRNFSHPDSFYPDRWLIAEGLQESTEKLVHNPNAYVPFSFGPANCVGKNLAMQEIRMVMCALLQRFRIVRGEGWDERRVEAEYKDYFTAPRPRFAVELHVRG